MVIRSIHIDSFGALKNRDFDLSEGLNIIEGANESGKSTVATFIKFMLYGLSGRKTDGDLSDKSKFASWDTGRASGSMVISAKGTDYRIEREYYAYADSAGEVSRDKCTVTDLYTGEKVFKNEVPGMAILGIPEQLFVNTVFVKQIEGSKIDGNGMAEAIENLLMSGDEGVSTKKAIEKLEKERVSLLHKNGDGGLLSDLQKEIGRLKQKLRDASHQNTEIIGIESTVEDLQDTVKARENEYSYYSAICDAYEKIKEKRKRDEARTYASQIAEIDERLDTLSGYGDINEQINEIVTLSTTVKGAEEKQKILRRREMELDRELPPLMSSAEIEDGEDDIDTAKSCREKKKRRISWGITLGLLGAAVVGADLFFNPPYHLILLSAAAGIILLAALIFTAGIVAGSKYKKIMAKWDVSSVEEIEKILSRKIELSERRRDPESDYSVTVAALRQAEEERISLTSELRSKALKFVSDEPDTDTLVKNAIDSAKEIARETDELIKLRNQTYGKYSVLESAFGNFNERLINERDREADALLETELGSAAAAMTKDEAANTVKKKKFAESALPSLRAQLADKEKQLSVLRATTADPMAISAQIETMEAQFRSAKERYDGITLAAQTLIKAGDNIRHSLLPRIRAEAERIIGNFTDGKYTGIGIDRRFDMTFMADGKSRDSAYFSAGTKDIAYVGLRMALAHVLFSENVPPIVYDESFARVDAERLYRIVRFLNDAGTDGVQSLLFTCRTLEGEIASDFDEINVINL